MQTPSRRRFLKAAGTTSALLSLHPQASPWLHAAAGDISVVATARIQMLRVLGRTLPQNVLKLFRVLPDPVNNRLYVSGILTQHVGVFDGTTHAVLGMVDTGIVGNSYKYMALDTTANRLYVHDGLNNVLVAINLTNGRVTGPVAVPVLTWQIRADSDRGLLYMLTPESPSFRILDGATLQTVATSTEMGSNVPNVLHDRASDSLWVLDQTARTPRIFQYNLASRAVSSTITVTLTGNQRPTGIAGRTSTGAFWLYVPGRGIIRVSTAGRIEDTLTLPALDFEDMVYDEAGGILWVLFIEGTAEGEVTGHGARMWRYDGRTWGETDAFGGKPHSLSLNTATGRLYSPSGDESAVFHTARTGGTMESWRVGDSVEYPTSIAGGPLVISSRLGGSYLTAYTPETGQASTFTSGTWPMCPTADGAGRYLAVLNAWDSTVSIFNQATRQLLATRSLGIAKGTTDRLPDLAVDFTRGFAYAAYPEFGTVAAVDWVNNRTLTPLTITGFTTGDTGGGPNQLQVALSESAGRLLVYAPSLRRLETYDITGAQPVRITQTTTAIPADSEGTSWKALFVDAPRDRAFVGIDAYDVRTGRALGIRAAAGDRVFANDDARTVYWTSSIDNDVLSVHTVNRSTLATVDSQVLGAANRIGVETILDTSRNLLYVTYLAAAELEAFQIA